MDFCAHLVASEPSESVAAELATFGQFVGSWDRFVWLGEYSSDEARTWHLEERMIATRT